MAAQMQLQQSAKVPSLSSAIRLQPALAQAPPQAANVAFRQDTTGAHQQRNVRLRAAAVDSEEDLEQYKDRDQWYVARFIAEDAPDWNVARFVRSYQVAPGLRNIVLEAEISREKVPIRNAYKHVGQRASVRVNSGPDREATVASAPFSQTLNAAALFKARGDMSSGEIKKLKVEVSVMAQLDLLVSEKGAEEVYNMGDDNSVEVGPFRGTGLDLRAMHGIYTHPTIVIFCEGRGIATARALIEAPPDGGGLNFEYRQDVRMYYRAPNEDSLCYKERFGEWEAQRFCTVIASTRESFMEMFDNDDMLTYEPSQTAAIVLTGGDEEAEAAALEVCKEAEIEVVSRDSVEQVPTQYLTKGRPQA